MGKLKANINYLQFDDNAAAGRDSARPAPAGASRSFEPDRPAAPTAQAAASVLQHYARSGGEARAAAESRALSEIFARLHRGAL
jgi:hypothetical protein